MADDDGEKVIRKIVVLRGDPSDFLEATEQVFDGIAIWVQDLAEATLPALRHF